MIRVITGMTKEPTRGVFWLIDNQIFSFPYYDDYSGLGVAKSGLTFNHKRLWNDVKPDEYKKYPYNYFPRGRVDFTNKGKPIIYLNPNIDDSYILDIKLDFGLREDPQIRYDHSEHYKCYLDDGWRADR